MSKIKVKTTLITPSTKLTYEALGELKDNIITYHEQDELTTLVTYDLTKDSLTRDNKQLTLNYLFKENIVTPGKLNIKDMQKDLELITKTNHLLKKDHYLEVEFLVENKKYTYILEWEA